MLNPSSLCKQKLYFNIKTEKICDIDQTTFNVINNLLYSYDDLIILNLYPYYSSNPQDLEFVKEAKRFKKVCLRNNRKFIKKLIKNKNKSDIYCAWGKTKPNSDVEISFIKKMLLKYDINKVKCKTKSKGQFVFANINSKQFINNIHGLFW